LTGFRDTVGGVSFSPDGRLLATIDRSGAVRVWDVRSGQELHPAALRDPGLGRVLWSVAFSPTGKHLAACGFGLNVWRVEHEPAADGPGRLALERVARPSQRYPITVRFNAQGNLLAWVESDHTLHLWDVSASQARPAPPGRLVGTVGSLAFDPDG